MAPASAWRPPPKLTVAEWADTERFLAPEYAAEPGQWKSRPYQIEPMEAFSDPEVEGVLYVGASQGAGKTELLVNVAGFHMDRDPCPMLIVEPNLEMAAALSKDRLAPTIRDTPSLAGKVKDPRTRDSGNTVRHKVFAGGHMTVVGANSAAGLAMRPIRIVLYDEIDRYPPSAGTEGDPVRLAWTRTRAFWNRRALYVTSPGTKGASRSEVLWERSDQRRWMIPCPDCGTEQFTKWSQVQWEKDEHGNHRPETAVYVCERCGSVWKDVRRWRAIKRGRWVAGVTDKREIAGFHLPAMSVLGFKLSELVTQWLEAQGNPELLKVFINTVLAEWWEEQYETVDETGLLKRREEYESDGTGRLKVPAPAAILTSGVDVQDNRLEISVYAWGRGEESWCMGHEVLFGDPSSPATWQELDAWLRRPWTRAAGGVDYIRGTCVDTGGHHTQAAYDFCGPRFRLPTPDGGLAYVFAIKGQQGAGEVWPRKASKITSKVPLWPIRVDPAKEQVYGRLQIAEPGPGYMHFPTELDEAFFKGLTAEKKVTRVNRKGFQESTWELRRAGIRNEPLDCGGYAYAALCGLRANGFDLDAEVETLGRRPVFEPPTTPTAASQQPAPEPPQSAPRRGSWLGDTDNWLRR